MDFEYKHGFKFNGLNHNLDLEKDKSEREYNKYLEQLRKKEQIERERNKVFDPSYMEINLPVSHLPVDISDNEEGGVLSFDPEFMTFNDKKR